MISFSCNGFNVSFDENNIIVKKDQEEWTCKNNSDGSYYLTKFVHGEENNINFEKVNDKDLLTVRLMIFNKPIEHSFELIKTNENQKDTLTDDLDLLKKNKKLINDYNAEFKILEKDFNEEKDN